MKKRIEKKKEKIKESEFMLKVCIADELKQDSIAHKIKQYFETGNICNGMLFKYDNKTKKVLISKKCLMYLLSFYNDVEQLHNYDFEIVDNINPLEN